MRRPALVVGKSGVGDLGGDGVRGAGLDHSSVPSESSSSVSKCGGLGDRGLDDLVLGSVELGDPVPGVVVLAGVMLGDGAGLDLAPLVPPGGESLLVVRLGKRRPWGVRGPVVRGGWGVVEAALPLPPSAFKA
jgi:hypothetical protein